MGQTFLLGYGEAMMVRLPGGAEAALEQVPRQYRGFAYEGAAMAFAIRDALSPGHGDRVGRFLAGRASDHVYMAYVGIGWAMARLPRPLRPRGDGLDPLLRWLVLDGYGFHQAYFHTRQYVAGQHVEGNVPWSATDPAGYAHRAVDQGIGRALWFVNGADPDRVVDAVERFAPQRQPDLFSGVGLAATYAGGTDEDGLVTLWTRAEEHQPMLTQGAAFGAEARARAGLVVPGTRLATEVLCGMSPEDAAEVTRITRPRVSVDAVLPAYEQWRQEVASWFVTVGGYR